MELVNLVQGSPQWLDYRRNMFNASEAGAVMACNPWKPKHPAELFDIKTGRDEVEVNQYMQRGTDMEDQARCYFNACYDDAFVPAVFKRGRYSASLDGINHAGTECVEIKCPNPSTLHRWRDFQANGTHLFAVAPYYWWQLVHQLYVCTTVKEVHFMVYDGEGAAYYQIYDRDEICGFFDALVARWEQFGDYLDRDQRPPNALDPVDARFEDMARNYLLATMELDAAKKHVDSLKKDLVRDYGETHAKGIKISKVIRRGNIDYSHKDIQDALSHLELDNYRKDDTEFWQISKDK